MIREERAGRDPENIRANAVEGGGIHEPYQQEGANLVKAAEIFGGMCVTMASAGAGAPLLGTVLKTALPVASLGMTPPPAGSPVPTPAGASTPIVTSTPKPTPTASSSTPIVSATVASSPPLSLWERFVAWLRSVVR